MEIEFDPAKDESNREKHGVSLALAAVVLGNLVGEEIDPDETGEERLIAYGRIDVRLFVCVYTMRWSEERGEVFRIISLRKGTKAEERRWLR